MEIHVPPQPAFDYGISADAFFKTPEMLAEIKRIVDSEVSTLNHTDKLTLIGTNEEDLGMYHHGYGRYLRNKYNLWNAQENAPKAVLTERWCKDGATHDLRDGVDYSVDHPDSVSMLLIRTLYHKCIYDRK